MIYDNIILRKKLRSGQLGWKRRHGYGQVLTPNDQVLVDKSKKLLVTLAFLVKAKPDDPKILTLLRMAWIRHVSLTYVEDIPLSVGDAPNLHRDISTYDAGKCEEHFRFTKQHLR